MNRAEADIVDTHWLPRQGSSAKREHPAVPPDAPAARSPMPRRRSRPPRSSWGPGTTSTPTFRWQTSDLAGLNGTGLAGQGFPMAKPCCPDRRPGWRYRSSRTPSHRRSGCLSYSTTSSTCLPTPSPSCSSGGSNRPASSSAAPAAAREQRAHRVGPLASPGCGSSVGWDVEHCFAGQGPVQQGGCSVVNVRPVAAPSDLRVEDALGKQGH